MPSKPFDWEAELNSTEPIENVQLDLDNIKKNIANYTNEKLCEMIVCDRYFGFGQQLSIVCMEELANRRLAGSTFDFEKYIETEQKSLPILDFSSPDIRSVLNQAVSQRKGQK